MSTTSTPGYVGVTGRYEQVPVGFWQHYVIDVGAGNDYIFSGYGDDYLKGGLGDDVINGLSSVDTIYGDLDADPNSSIGGNDQLFGSSGSGSDNFDTDMIFAG